MKSLFAAIMQASQQSCDLIDMRSPESQLRTVTATWRAGFRCCNGIYQSKDTLNFENSARIDQRYSINSSSP